MKPRGSTTRATSWRRSSPRSPGSRSTTGWRSTSTGFEEMVDAVGGVTVDNPVAFNYTHDRGESPGRHLGRRAVSRRARSSSTAPRRSSTPAPATRASSPSRTTSPVRSARRGSLPRFARSSARAASAPSGPGCALMDAMEGRVRTDLSAIDLFLLSSHLASDRRIELTEGPVADGDDQHHRPVHPHPDRLDRAGRLRRAPGVHRRRAVRSRSDRRSIRCAVGGGSGGRSPAARHRRHRPARRAVRWSLSAASRAPMCLATDAEGRILVGAHHVPRPGLDASRRAGSSAARPLTRQPRARRARRRASHVRVERLVLVDAHRAQRRELRVRRPRRGRRAGASARRDRRGRMGRSRRDRGDALRASIGSSRDHRQKPERRWVAPTRRGSKPRA